MFQGYVGEWMHPYGPTKERIVSNVSSTDKLGQLSVSNASKRRLDGYERCRNRPSPKGS
jgi:citrate synthase